MNSMKISIGVLILIWGTYSQAAILRVPSEYPTIQSAVDQAISGDTVLVENGLFTGIGNTNVTAMGKEIVIESEGGPSSCLIDCQNLSSAFIFDHNETSLCQLRGFTVQNAASGSNGGAIFCSASPVIENCHFINCQAMNGGAIAFKGDHITPTLNNSLFVDNSANEEGGAIYSQKMNGMAASDASSEAIDVTGPSLSITRCTLAGNHAATGGGLFACNTALQLESSTFSGNEASYGSAMYLQSPGEGTISNTVFSGNSSESGILAALITSITIQNCVFSDNTSLDTGALYFSQSGTISNTIFYNNHGTAMYGSYPIISNCLFEGNQEYDYWDMYSEYLNGADAINLEGYDAHDIKSGDPLFLNGPSGSLTAAPEFDPAADQTIVTDTAASFTPDELTGKLISIGSTADVHFLVASNSATQIRIWSEYTEEIQSGDSYQILDYHLQDGSSALDRANLVYSAPTDMDGDPRPGSDQLADIGVDEADSDFVPPADTIPPTSYLLPCEAVLLYDAIYLNYEASDSQSGIDHTELFYRVLGSDWTYYTSDIDGVFQVEAVDVGDGRCEFCSIAVDVEGNIEPFPDEPDTTTLVCTSFTGERIYVDQDGTTLELGISWDYPFHLIQDAITIGSNYGVYEIWVAEGDYHEAISMSDYMQLYGGFEGTEIALEDRRLDLFPTIIDGRDLPDGTTAYHVVYCYYLYGNIRLDGFTFKGGKANGESWPDNFGAGIYVYYCTSGLDIANCTIQQNSAEDGAGIYIDDSEVKIADSQILSNSAANYGGGIYCYNTYGYDIILENCIIADNQAEMGGGFFTTPQVPMHANKLYFVGNKSTSNGGAFSSSAMYSASEPTNEYSRATGAQFYNSFFVGNHAETGGSALNLSRTIDIVNSVIASNTCPDASSGTLHSWVEYDIDSFITNSIFYNNSGYAIKSEQSLLGVYRSNLFHGNETGLFYDLTNQAGYFTAEQVNLNVIGAFNTIDGDPLFQTEITGTWTENPDYDENTHRTTLIDSSAVWEPGTFSKWFVQPDDTNGAVTIILANSENSVTVPGSQGASVEAGDTYKIFTYHLMDGSPALDRADQAYSPSDDFEFDDRPGEDLMSDIGADEAPSSYVPPVDSTSPVSYVDPMLETTCGPVFNITFRASDTESGVEYVELYYSKESGPWTKYMDHFTSQPISFDSTTTGGNGYYSFYTIATDFSGNIESAPASADTSTTVIDPTPTPTRTPTRTPTATRTPTPTRTPTTTSTPINTSTPTPTITASPTSTPFCNYGAKIDMPSHLFHSHDLFYCRAIVCNPAATPINNYPLFVILDVLGTYFFAPSFNMTFDCYLKDYPSFQPGLTTVQVIQEFVWPETGSTLNGVKFYAALTDPEIKQIEGEMDTFVFGWTD